MYTFYESFSLSQTQSHTGVNRDTWPAIRPDLNNLIHDDVIKWKHFPRYWPLVRGIHRSPVNSPHRGQWRGDLMFSLICAWINAWVNNHEAGDLRHHRAHHDATVMCGGQQLLLSPPYSSGLYEYLSPTNNGIQLLIYACILDKLNLS